MNTINLILLLAFVFLWICLIGLHLWQQRVFKKETEKRIKEITERHLKWMADFEREHQERMRLIQEKHDISMKKIQDDHAEFMKKHFGGKNE